MFTLDEVIRAMQKGGKKGGCLILRKDASIHLESQKDFPDLDSEKGCVGFLNFDGFDENNREYGYSSDYFKSQTKRNFRFLLKCYYDYLKFGSFIEEIKYNEKTIESLPYLIAMVSLIDEQRNKNKDCW